MVKSKTPKAQKPAAKKSSLKKTKRGGKQRKGQPKSKAKPRTMFSKPAGANPMSHKTASTFVRQIRRGNSSNMQDAEQATALLSQCMDPLSTSVMRMQPPNEVSSTGTAVARLINKSAYDWNVLPDPVAGQYPTLESSTGQVPILDIPSDFPVVLLRDPVVRYITRELKPSGSGIPSYSVTISWIGIKYLISEYVITSTEHDLQIAYATPSTGWEGYGKMLPCGSVGNQRVIWVDASQERQAVVHFIGTSTSDADIIFRAYRWDSNGSDKVNVYENTVLIGEGGFSVDLNITGSGYHSFTVLAKNPDDNLYLTTLTMVIDTNTDAVFRHHMPTDLDTKMLTVENVRVLGVSLLLSNTSPEWQKGGTLTAAQVQGNEMWFTQFLSRASLDELNPQIVTTKSWDNGLYCYFRPSSGATLSPWALRPAFRHPKNSDKASIPLPEFRPFDQEGFVLVRVVPPPTIVNTGPGGGGSLAYLTVTTLFEYQTNDQFFDVEKAFNSSAAFDIFVSELRLAPQFYDNPFHWNQVRDFIAKGLGAVIKYGPGVMSTAGTLLSLL